MSWARGSWLAEKESESFSPPPRVLPWNWHPIDIRGCRRRPDLEKLLREIEILDDGLLPMHPEVSKTSVRTSQEQPDIGLPKTRH